MDFKDIWWGHGVIEWPRQVDRRIIKVLLAARTDAFIGERVNKCGVLLEEKAMLKR